MRSARSLVHISSCLFPVKGGFFEEGKDFFHFSDLYFNAFVLDSSCFGNQIDDVLQIDLLDGEISLKYPLKLLARFNTLEYLFLEQVLSHCRDSLSLSNLHQGLIECRSCQSRSVRRRRYRHSCHQWRFAPIGTFRWKCCADCPFGQRFARKHNLVHTFQPNSCFSISHKWLWGCCQRSPKWYYFPSAGVSLGNTLWYFLLPPASRCSVSSLD